MDSTTAMSATCRNNSMSFDKIILSYTTHICNLLPCSLAIVQLELLVRVVESIFYIAKNLNWFILGWKLSFEPGGHDRGEASWGTGRCLGPSQECTAESQAGWPNCNIISPNFILQWIFFKLVKF